MAGYVTDLVTEDYGNIYFRESNSAEDLELVDQYIGQEKFANHVIIVTFEDVITFSSAMMVSRFVAFFY